MARFFRRGISEIHILPAVAAYDPATGTGSPTRLEIDAGVDLSQQIADIGGLQVQGSRIPTPNLKDKFTPSIDGEDTVADSSLRLYDLDDSTVERTALAKGTVAFLWLMPYGDTPTKRGEVWPVKSMGVNDEWTLASEPARYDVGFAVLNPPNQSATIPA